METWKTYCPGCLHELRWLRMRCPGCHRSTVSWLHVAIAAALDAAGLAHLLRLF
jgi:ribosomal protein S27E